MSRNVVSKTTNIMFSFTVKLTPLGKDYISKNMLAKSNKANPIAVDSGSEAPSTSTPAHFAAPEPVGKGGTPIKKVGYST